MTQQERSGQTRLRILSAAVETFTRHGFDATSVSDICRDAGVSKGAFYHHFPTKQAVFVALLEDWLEDLHGSVRRAIGSEPHAQQRLRRLAALIDRVTVLGTGRIPMFLEFWRQASKEPEIWRATVEPFQEFRTSVARLIADGVTEGSFRPVDPEGASLALVSMAVGLILQGALEPSQARGPAGGGRSDVATEAARRGGAETSARRGDAEASARRGDAETSARSGDAETTTRRGGAETSTSHRGAGEAAMELLLRGLAPEEYRDSK